MISKLTNKKKLQITNCFGIPFEEDKDDPANIWYLDHIFLETMYGMMRKINSKEIIV
jgi:26S proteasome regulatory subunit N8